MSQPQPLGAKYGEALPNYNALTVSGYSGGGFAVLRTCALATFNVTTSTNVGRLHVYPRQTPVSRSAFEAARPVQFRQQPAGERAVQFTAAPPGRMAEPPAGAASPD